MYSLLIIDDEKIIREGLITYIDWPSLGVEVTGVFGSAKEALADAVRRTPDLILSDIKMTGMNGVEFLKELRGAGCDSQVIFISAYRNFDYAKAAVRYGAFEYLLKPIREDQLYETVRRCLTKLRETALAAGHLNTDPVTAIHSYLSGSPDAASWTRAAAALDLDPGAPVVVVAGRRIPGAPPPRAVPGPRAVVLAETETAVVVAGFGGTVTEAHATAEALAGRYFLAGTPYGWSGAEKGVHLSRLCTEALWGLIGVEAWPLRCQGGFVSSMNYARTAPAAPSASDRVAAWGREESEQGASMARFLLSLLAEGLAYDLVLIKARAIKTLDAVADELEAFPHFSPGLEPFRARIDRLARPSNVYDLYREVASLLDEMSAFVRERYAGHLSRLVSLVAGYLKDQLAADLSLEAVASHFHVSPTYLSRVFSREMGEGFSHYRARERVEKAKVLLKDPQRRVAEVARLVGLDNVSHFTKLFGTLVGTSPTEYRNKLQ